MNEPIYGCAGCNTTAGAGGCPVHGTIGIRTGNLQLRITEPGVEVDAAWDAHCERHASKERELKAENAKLLLQLSEEKKLSTLWMEKSDENEKAAIEFRLQVGQARLALEAIEKSTAPDHSNPLIVSIHSVAKRGLSNLTEKLEVSTPKKIVHCEGVYCLGTDKCQCKCYACLQIVNF